ncbi:DUF2867 domain-containing protein [Umezawaea endophytica]|uniref:DUF2867 domain-containing protein n=1 Tax=Umezawaea endophytica TaxID=1654476 RepID=A0A9X2VSH9_9PSEU|nr:DUF2867 domain-containing protein [Umezawaea endophytica]MCS7482031.1 DUF2867 domain-containing protein [Umezawaea endophytica]
MPTPASSALHDSLPHVDYADAHSAPLPEDAPTDPHAWVTRLFSNPPRTFRLLMGARDRLVGTAGLKKGSFPELLSTAEEVVLGVDDLHLDFRVGVRVDPGRGLVTVGTVVRFHNLFGRLYFLPVRAVHAVVVRSMLRHATERRPGNA